MPLNLASPGIVVREVDLTVGRVNAASDKVGALVAPFTKGPVNLPTLIETEQDLIDNFGEPVDSDKHYEHWMVASSYLAYGGALRVVRSDDAQLNNANAGFGTTSTLKILSLDDYNNKGYDATAFTNATFAARNPGSWANGLVVAVVDGKADQRLTGVNTNNATVGMGVTQTISKTVAGAGTTTVIDGYLRGVITGFGVGTSQLDVKIVSHVSAGGTETAVSYQQGGVWAFTGNNGVGLGGTNPGVVIVKQDGNNLSGYGSSITAALDWYDQQTITLTNSTISWNGVADRPGTTAFAAARSSKNDEIHVVVIDDKGEVTGNAGTILEKHLNLSKAKDAEFSVGSPSYWRKYLATNSRYVFAGVANTSDTASSGVGTLGGSRAITDSFVSSVGPWNQNAQGVTFDAIGAKDFTLVWGKNYDGSTGIGSTGSMEVSLSGLVAGYDLFENTDQYDVDFLLMGSANHEKEVAQALANKLIAVADLRKDALAFVTPYRKAFLNDTTSGSVTVNSDATITDNVISFYSPITSSSFAVFDSGYKYMYDRFADTFRYVPLNGDMAGLCARNDINNFPWFSPAGTARGAILNAVKLAYNPSKTQRDRLYSNRVNPVIFSPGAGITLFGDKTGLGRASAFDRINVRRLFIYLENAISAAARDQMFEFNDEITRTNFVNTVEPFLRDVQAKRGIYDFRVICDETNNTAAIIDNNEFVADIFVKPARSINFIGLTFVATRTGVSFDEVVGTV